MAYEVVMPYHLHMPSYFLETFTEYPYSTHYLSNKRLLIEQADFLAFIHLIPYQFHFYRRKFRQFDSCRTF